eukprot:1145094-Pelagomonas_calceolata.AAC.3
MALPLKPLSVHGAPFSVPKYLHLDLGKHKLRNTAHIRLHAKTLEIETSLWQEHTSECDRCDQGGFLDENMLCSFAPVSFCVLHFLQKQNFETYRVSPISWIFCVAGTVEQAEQPNYLAEGRIPL